MLVSALLLDACASSRKVPKESLQPVAMSPACTTIGVDQRFGDWRQLTTHGVTFCVPSDWKFDTRFDAVQSQRSGRAFRSLSWTGPDTAQRLIMDVASSGSARDELARTIKYCQNDLELGNQTGCATYGPLDRIAVTLPEPLVRFRVKGSGVAWKVVTTVRAVPSANND